MGISIRRVLGTAVYLCLAFLCAVTHNVTDHKTMGAAAVQNTFQVFQLFGFDDDFQLFESQSFFFGDFISYFPTESNSLQISSDGALVARDTITMASADTTNAGSSS